MVFKNPPNRMVYNCLAPWEDLAKRWPDQCAAERPRHIIMIHHHPCDRSKAKCRPFLGAVENKSNDKTIRQTSVTIWRAMKHLGCLCGVLCVLYDVCDVSLTTRLEHKVRSEIVTSSSHSEIQIDWAVSRPTNNVLQQLATFQFPHT